MSAAALDHLILNANDRDASVAFYRDVLGFAYEVERGPFSVLRGTEGNQHLAFAFSREAFEAAFARVRAAADPEAGVRVLHRLCLRPVRIARSTGE